MDRPICYETEFQIRKLPLWKFCKKLSKPLDCERLTSNYLQLLDITIESTHFPVEFFRQTLKIIAILVAHNAIKIAECRMRNFPDSWP